MALVPYVNTGVTVPLSAAVAKANELGTSNRNLMAAVGDYWRDYFTETDILNAFNAGYSTLVSKEYTRLLRAVLSSSLLSIPTQYPEQFQLLILRSDLATITENYIEYPLGDWAGVDFLTSSIFEPHAALKDGVDYEVDTDSGVIRFFVDVFNDSAITKYTYTGEFSGIKCTLLWGGNVLLDSYYIYERFGKFLYSKDVDSEAYKNIVIALQYYYTTTKSIPKIEATINILFGLPFSRVPGETVLSITYADQDLVDIEDIGGAAVDSVYYKVTTDASIYYAPYFSMLLVEVGQQLVDYELISRFHTVNDWRTNPTWYDGVRAPHELIVSFTDPEYLAAFTEEGEFSEYMPYISQQYNKQVRYDGSRNYVGANGISITNGTGASEAEADLYGGLMNPLLQTRLYSTSTSWRYKLYRLVDNILKYNLVYFRTVLNFDTIDVYTRHIPDLQRIIATGFPVYLYPLIDVIFEAEFIDSSGAGEAGFAATAEFALDREVFVRGDQMNGINTYGKVLQYSGAVLYGGSTGNDLTTNAHVTFVDDQVVMPVPATVLLKYNGSFGYTGDYSYSKQYAVTRNEVSDYSGTLAMSDAVTTPTDDLLVRGFDRSGTRVF